MRQLSITILIVLGAASVGCNGTPAGTRRVLGPVAYDQALAAARDVIGQYFTIDQSETRAGHIKSHPRLVEVGRFRLSGPAPARQVATCRLTRDGQYVVVLLAVAVHRQVSSNAGMAGLEEENYSGVPNRTPAQLDGATTPEQNTAWRLLYYDHKLERTILDDLARRLNRQGYIAPEPPAKS